MKRWTLRILLCLILLVGGAITTVAVAWGCITFQDYKDAELVFREHAVSPDMDSDLTSAEWRASGSSLFLGTAGAIYLPRMGGEELPLTSDQMPRFISPLGRLEVAESAGWPQQSLYWELRHDTGVGIAVLGGWTFGDGDRIVTGPAGQSLQYGEFDRVLPFKPIWSGFLIDTLFYAAIWGGMFFGFASAKRAIRRRRGRCPRCGYDLRGGVMSDQRLAISGEEESATLKPQASGLKPSSGCPECGWNRMQESAP